jgi:hypothetical protein
MTGWRKLPALLLSLLLMAGPSLFSPAAPARALSPALPVTPVSSTEEEERSSSSTEVTVALDFAHHARRSGERHGPHDRRRVLHPPRQHHRPAVLAQTPPVPFWATVNPPQRC